MLETNALVKKEAGEVTAPEATRGGIYYTPPVDIYESADEVALQCDMPGVKPQDVDVRFEKGKIDLYGKIEPRRGTAECLSEEYGVGDFFRSFTIGPEINVDNISADYREGVLTLRLPKQERVKPKRIAVQGS